MKNNRLKFCVICSVLLSSLWTQQALALNLYVSPNGNDTWSGQIEQPNSTKTDGPLATLNGARDRLRQLRPIARIPEPIRVIIADGRYTLSEPFVLEPQDSGVGQLTVSYEAAPGTRPVFTGGRTITGFKRGENGIWQAQIPDVASGKWYFEQLFVNGRRAVRARTPNEFYHYMGGTAEEQIAGENDKFRRTTNVPSDALKPLKELSSDEIKDVTLIAYHKWCISRRFVTEIDFGKNAIITIGEKLKSYSGWPKNTRFQLENFRTALDTPGEWFLSRDGMLSYMPLTGEDMSKAQVAAPVIDKLVVFQGDPENGKFVEHINLKGLVFEHNQELLPRTGYAPYQAAYVTEAAIMADGARNVTIADCEVGHSATYAV